MGTFRTSLSRELGKNTGKWVSNKVFGDGHATPHKVIHARERENARREREEARNYRERQKEIERERREQEKRLVQLEKEAAEKERQLMIEANIEEVKEHDNYINIIQSVHKDYSKTIDWHEIKNQSEPEPVETADELKNYYRKLTDDQINQKITQAKESTKLSIAKLIIGNLYTEKHRWIFTVLNHKISLISFVIISLWSMSVNAILGYAVAFILFAVYYLFKLGLSDLEKDITLKDKISTLEESREIWYREYIAEQDERHKSYLEAVENHRRLIQIADGVIQGDTQAITYAINFFNPFDDLNEYGSDISFQVTSNSIYIDFYVHSQEVIPNTVKSVLRKGSEVKEEPMPTSRFNELYQDYVCSCILRIAKEIFQLIPTAQNVVVNAKGSVINSATGNYEEQTIVSANIDRSKLSQLNFDLLDPSDSMSNFEHNMDFKKLEGFKPVRDLLIPS